jgi:hypothetical protein
VDPDSLNPDPDTDPDPAFQVNPDTNPFPNPDPGFYDQKLKKKIQMNFLNIFLIKNSSLLIPGLHKRRPTYRKSLQPSKEHFKR